MKLPEKEEEELLKQTVVKHFVDGYSRLLKDSGSKSSDIRKEEFPSSDEVRISAGPGAEDVYRFNADFNVKNYRITFQGTINKNQEIRDEVLWGKRNFR